MQRYPLYDGFVVGERAGRVRPFTYPLQANLLAALLAIPIGIFKNAVRIVTLSYLGVYVDRAYLEGRLHHQYGGLVFSSLALFLVVPLLILLRKSEAHAKGGAHDARPVRRSPRPISSLGQTARSSRGQAWVRFVIF